MAAGAKSYFTGKPCKSGHVALRFTLSGHCSECDKIRDKARDSDPGRKDAKRTASRLSQRKRRASDASLVAREREYDQARKARPEIREKERERMRLKRLDPDFIAKERQYKRDHPEQVAAQNSRRRARVNQAEGSHTPADILRIFLSQGRKCGECGARVNKSTWHIDHIIPLSKGGSNWPTNIQILCRPCNLEKHASDPIDFARRKGRLI
ncbi:HNH endonuclease [Rhizobium sp. 12,4]|uniref:HNH endonuclease n=1 Tax=Rhizobium sp. 12,4 TaxID=3405135 RepID=UPI003D338208